MPMEESRPRFVEAAEMIIEGLNPDTANTMANSTSSPAPPSARAPTRTFKGRTYAAAVSPESAEIMAKLGVGLLIIPQKPWDHVARAGRIPGIVPARQRLRRAGGRSPRAGPVVDESEERAYEMAKKYIGGYWHSVLVALRVCRRPSEDHQGRRILRQVAENLQKQGDDAATEFFLGLQVWARRRCATRDRRHFQQGRLRQFRRRFQVCRHAEGHWRSQYAPVRQRRICRN